MDTEDLKKEAEKDLFESLGAKDIPNEEKGELLAKMMDLVQKRVVVRISEQLNDEQIKEFERLVEAGDDEATEKYLEAQVPDYDRLFVEEAKKLRHELIINLSE
jgi:succinate dehydrogenase flavin-adding protein (antitoxin of CptAB toxin-antitoxin module)